MNPKSILKFIAISSLITFLLFIALELLLRESVTSFRSLDNRDWLETSPELLIKHTGTGRRLVPNAAVVVKNHFLSGLDVTIETNTYGFRAAPISPAKEDDEIRILALGDSITIGDHLPLEAAFTHKLEQKLAKQLPDKKVAVINAGVMGIGLKEQITILKESGLKISPDIVLVNFYLNNGRPSWGFTNETRHRGWLRRHSVAIEFMYNQLKLFQWISEQGSDRFTWITTKDTLPWATDRDAFKQLVEDARYDWGSAWEDSLWNEIMPLFDELKSLSIAHNFKVILATFPVSFQVYSSVFDSWPQKKVQSIAAAFGFTPVDLLPALSQAAKTDAELFYDQCHPTATGDEITATTLAAPILQMLKDQ